MTGVGGPSKGPTPQRSVVLQQLLNMGFRVSSSSIYNYNLQLQLQLQNNYKSFLFLSMLEKHKLDRFQIPVVHTPKLSYTPLLLVLLMVLVPGIVPSKMCACARAQVMR